MAHILHTYPRSYSALRVLSGARSPPTTRRSPGDLQNLNLKGLGFRPEGFANLGFRDEA